MKDRVVITGLGINSSIGDSIPIFWKNCLGGKIGTSKINKKGLEIVGSSQGGQIKELKTKNKNLGRSCQLLISGLNSAIVDARLDKRKIDRVLVGTTMGETTIDYTLPITNSGKINTESLLRQNQLDNLLCDALQVLQITDVETCLFCNACSGGNYALIAGYEAIKNKKAEKVIVGGVDSFSTIAYYGFSRLNAVAQTLCRPFDKNRDGMLVAEGVGCLVLESEQSALSRGAKIYSEIAGYGISSDAFHINAPHPKGLGIKMATENALKYANLIPERIDYISAHGTGTIANDRIESKILGQIFGSKKPISSVKAMLGHTMGAASAIESIVCCLAVFTDKIPATVNFLQRDLECQIDCVPNKSRSQRINYAMNNSYAFGGSNASIIFKKYGDK